MTTQHYTNYITLHYTTPLSTTLPHYTTLHYITPHYTTLRHTTLNYTTLHYPTLYYIKITLHYTHHTSTISTATTLPSLHLITLRHNYNSKVWMKGFLPSQWYVPVSTLLPVSKVLSFSPPQRSWFPNRIPGKLSHVRGISQGQVFSHSEGSRSRLPKKTKIK